LFQIEKPIRRIDRFEDVVVGTIAVRRLPASKHINGLKKFLPVARLNGYPDLKSNHLFTFLKFDLVLPLIL
jgi:hypothetical protein